MSVGERGIRDDHRDERCEGCERQRRDGQHGRPQSDVAPATERSNADDRARHGEAHRRHRDHQCQEDQQVRALAADLSSAPYRRNRYHVICARSTTTRAVVTAQMNARMLIPVRSAGKAREGARCRWREAWPWWAGPVCLPESEGNHLGNVGMMMPFAVPPSG